MSDIVERLMDACNGHPHAKIPWPHRLLHEAADEIASLRSRLERAKEGLQEVAKKEGRFNRDPFEHCQNCVEDMAEIAEDTLRELDQTGGGDE